MNSDVKKTPGPLERSDLQNEAAITQFLAELAPDLEVSARDAAESLRDYAERMLSALQDVEFNLISDLQDLAQDLQAVIDHLDQQQAEAPR